MTGEGKAVSFLTLKNINENHFWSPKAIAYRRKTYPPRACHLAVTARPSQREGGFICSQSPTEFRQEPPVGGLRWDRLLTEWRCCRDTGPALRAELRTRRLCCRSRIALRQIDWLRLQRQQNLPSAEPMLRLPGRLHLAYDIASDLLNDSLLCS